MGVLAKKGQSLEDFTYNDEAIAKEIYSAMNATQFLGVSGTVAFSSKGDRIAWTLIEQMIDGQYHKVAYYDTQTNNLSWLTEPQWIGGKVPQDRTIIIEKLRTVSYGLFVTMSVISSLGIAIAVGLIAFNIVYRDQKLIELSQPTYNNIMLLGIILLLSSVFLMGMDGDSVSASHFPIVCQLRAWLLCCGFTLAFGAMFIKVWRVHRQSTKSKEESSKTKEEPRKEQTRKQIDWIFVGLVSVDVLVLLIWLLVDPLYRYLENFQLETPLHTDEDIKIKPSLEHCESEHQNIWLGVLYGYKGLLLIFGLFLAYETRSMKIKNINDSRYVGMSIYNVVVLCLITAPVSLVISSQADASFAFITSALVFCCFLSMAVIFVPKVVEVIRHPDCPKGDVSEEAEQTVSKEEEERCRKLLQENEQLQQLIAAREHKLKMLNQRLQDRNASGIVNGNAPTNGSAQMTVHPPPSKKNSEVRFATSALECLPSKTRIGVGIMKHTETTVIERDGTSTATNTSTTVVLGEELCTIDRMEVELDEKVTDASLFQGKDGGSIHSPEESYL